MSFSPGKIREVGIERPAYEGSGSGFRVMLYSHDTFGLGHISRSLKIAASLKQRFPGLSVLTVTGSPQAHNFVHPAGTDYIKLPSVHKVEDEGYAARFLDLPFKNILAIRMSILLETITNYQPHVLLVDHAPLGMKKEIIPCLRWVAENRAGSRAVLGLRDILDNPSSTKKRWFEQGVYDALRELYDRVLIYGMSDIYDPVSEYDFPDDIRAKTDFCGYIAGYGNSDEDEGYIWSGESARKLILVTIGGGDGGEQVIARFLEALSLSHRYDYECVILTGPFLGAQEWTAFKKEAGDLGISIARYSTDIGSLMRRSNLVISTGGYNTITDILSFARKAIIVPRILYREEQLIRARRFSELGLVRLIHPDELTAESLIRAIDETIDDNSGGLSEARREGRVRLDGAARLAGFIGESLAEIEKEKEKAL